MVGCGGASDILSAPALADLCGPSTAARAHRSAMPPAVRPSSSPPADAQATPRWCWFASTAPATPGRAGRLSALPEAIVGPTTFAVDGSQATAQFFASHRRFLSDPLRTLVVKGEALLPRDERKCMTNQNLTLIAALLDRSGSMQDCKRATETGFDELIAKQRSEPQGRGDAVDVRRRLRERLHRHPHRRGGSAGAGAAQHDGDARRDGAVHHRDR